MIGEGSQLLQAGIRTSPFVSGIGLFFQEYQSCQTPLLCNVESVGVSYGFAQESAAIKKILLKINGDEYL